MLHARPLKNHRFFIGMTSVLLICGSFALPSMSADSAFEDSSDLSMETSAVLSEKASTANMASAAREASALRSMLKGCYSPKIPTPAKPMKVNGHLLDESQAKNIQWFGRCVVPFLPGTREEQAEAAARTSWWALREGNLGLPSEKIFRYSLCHERAIRHGRRITTDVRHDDSPLYNCSTNIWQVGIAAGQVANYSEKEYEEMTDKIFSALDSRIQESEILKWTANLAGFKEGSKEFNGIVRSKDRVKRSWLLRNPLIGTMLVQDLEVHRECFIDGNKRGKRGGCFGGRYPEAMKFGHSSTAMRRSVADLKRIYLLGLAE